MAFDPATNSWHVQVTSAMILEHASYNAIAQRVHDEVVAYLVADPDFRILVSEGVREAMNKLNVGEVVQAAVEQVLKAARASKGGLDGRAKGEGSNL